MFALSNCLLAARLLSMALTLMLLNEISSYAQECPVPTNLYATDVTSCAVTLHWRSTGSVQKYSVRYKLSSAAQWSPSINVHKDTVHRFEGLLASSTYKFQITAKCTNGVTSKKGNITVTTAFCVLPSSASLYAVDFRTIGVTVSSACAYDSVRIKYRTLTGEPTIVASAPSAAYSISDLISDSTYVVQVSTCPLSANNWTPTDTITLSSLPNVLIVMLDDCRYDNFSCTGAPSFFQTPNIDRIANEGVNFRELTVQHLYACRVALPSPRDCSPLIPV